MKGMKQYLGILMGLSVVATSMPAAAYTSVYAAEFTAPEESETEFTDVLKSEEIPELEEAGSELTASANETFLSPQNQFSSMAKEGTDGPKTYNINESPVKIEDECGDSCPGHIINGTNIERQNTITVSGGKHNITLNGVYIDMHASTGISAMDLSSAGECTITLKGNNSLEGGYDRPGIYVPYMNKLTIKGDGKLEARGGQSWPGIGRDGNGNIEIQSGDITAFGGNCGAGIGGSWSNSGANITISGGTVTAYGGDGAAGIGGGCWAGRENVIISGGVVMAYGKNGGQGIGGGDLANNDGYFGTGDKGSAIILTNNPIRANEKTNWHGVIVEGDKGEVYGGNTTINQDWTIPEDKVVTVPKDTTLTVNGTLVNNGRIVGEGVLDGSGKLEGSGEIGENITNKLRSNVAITVEADKDVIYDGTPQKGYTDLSCIIKWRGVQEWNGKPELFYERNMGSAEAPTWETTTQANSGAEKDGGAPVNAGSYKVTVKIPDDNQSYTGSGSAEFTIQPQPLASPTNLSLSSTTSGKVTAKWDDVANANGYSIQLCKDDDTSYVVASTKKTKTTRNFLITETGSYTLKVTAKGTGNYTNSEATDEKSLTFHQVNFDSKGGSTTPEAQIVAQGGKVEKPQNPTKSSYTFDGWYSNDTFTEDSKWDFGTPVMNDVTLYAKWVYYSSPTYYTLAFNTNGGSGISSVEGAYGTSVDLTLDKYIPTREGYTFSGWYTDEKLTDRITSIKLYSSQTIYAGWTPIPTATPSPTETPTATPTPTAAPSPDTDTSDFNPSVGTKFSSAKAVNGTAKVTLSWKKVKGADGYQIYWYNRKTEKYERMKTVLDANVTTYTTQDFTYGQNQLFKIRAFSVNKKGDRTYGKFGSSVKIKTGPAATTAKTVKSTKKQQVTVTWKKVSNADGYQIYRSTGKNGTYTKMTTITGNKTYTKTLKNQKSGKKYYYKVRAYITGTDGKHIYGKFSTPKSVKIK